METIRRKRRSIIIAFILSLLFHASLMIYLLWQRTDPINNMPIPTPEEIIKRETKQNDNSWVETKARASNFGAPVFFEDEPAFAEATADRPQQETIEKPEIDAQPENKQEDPETNSPELERNIDIPDPEEISTPLPQQKDTTTTQPPRRTRAPREKKEEPVQRQPQKTAPQPAQRQPSPPNSKQLPTLAQLTQGFMNHVKHSDGQHLVSMIGSKKGLPSDEQMKYERYLQKLNACITTSFSIHRGGFSSSSRIENDTWILIVLNKDGTPKQISLRQSSGNKELDAFILLVIRDASSSFPPVPHYLPHNPFAITLISPTKTEERSNSNITIRMR